MRLLKWLLALTGVLFLVTAGYWIWQHRSGQRFPFEKSVPQADIWTLQYGPTTLVFAHRVNDWTVSAGSGAFTADINRVKKALDNFQALSVEDEISDRADRASEFEVDAASGVRVELMKGPASLGAVILGKPAPDVGHSYIRFPEMPNVYLAKGIVRATLFPIDLKNWRSKDLWFLNDDPIVSILIETPSARTYLLRSSDTWTCNGEPADKTAAESLASQLHALRADEVVDLPIPADLAPEKLTFARIVVQTKSSAHELHLGTRDAKFQRSPAALANDTNIVWLYDYRVNALLKTPSDFLPASPQK